MNRSGGPAGQVVVTSVGAATAIGATAGASAAAVRAGLAGFSDHPYMIDRRGDPFVVGMAPYLNPNFDAAERISELTRMAAIDAVRNLPPILLRDRRVMAVVGVPNARPGVDDPLFQHVADGLRLAMPDRAGLAEVTLLPHGHASALMALEAATTSLRDGTADYVLAGGADSYIDVDTLEWLDSCDRLHVPDNAWGFVPGEGAGFSLLCSVDTAARDGLTSVGHLVAVATAREANRIYTDTVCLGQGLTAAVRQVFAALHPDARIDATICDQNGEAYRADECGFLLARTSERFVDGSNFATPADCWGDVGAASGALFVSLAAFAAAKGYQPGPRTLIWASSEGGERAAALIDTGAVASEMR